MIANELKEERIRKKREEYIRKYHSRMAGKDSVKGYTFAPLPDKNTSGGPTDLVRQSAATIINRRATVKDSTNQVSSRKGEHFSRQKTIQKQGYPS